MIYLHLNTKHAQYGACIDAAREAFSAAHKGCQLSIVENRAGTEAFVKTDNLDAAFIQRLPPGLLIGAFRRDELDTKRAMLRSVEWEIPE